VSSRARQSKRPKASSPSWWHVLRTPSAAWITIPLFVALLALYIVTLRPPSPEQAAKIRDGWRAMCRHRYSQATTKADTFRIDVSLADTLITDPRSGGTKCGELRARGEL
jgi:hypothetical protein